METISNIPKDILKKEIRNASLEAIYWWNRSEGYYHSYFHIYKEKIYPKKINVFFIEKVFNIFLREYSVRRNFASGKHNSKLLLDTLVKYNFFDEVKETKQNKESEIIDLVSENLKNIDTTNIKGKKVKLTKNRTTSLLSKIAFLINPSSFFLNDKLATKSVNQLTKGKLFKKTNNNNCYLKFYNKAIEVKNFLENEQFFNISKNELENFKNSIAYSFFSDNINAYQMRVVDKFLWLREINNERKINGDNTVENTYYEMFFKTS